MERTGFRNVDDYLASLPARARDALSQVRAAIRAGVPDGEEVISYGVPAVKHNGWVLYFSAAKGHWSLSQPPPFAAFTEFAAELEPYGRSKSAVRFPYDAAVPTDLITRMAAFQAAENDKQPARKGRR